MSRLLLIFPVLCAAGAIWALAAGFDQDVAAWAMAWQREFQNGLAGTLRALRAGEPGAVAAVLGLCFAYGFFHALGPGHGKFLIGGYGVSTDVSLIKLATISLLASVGQAVTAITLVLAGLLLLGWTRSQLVGAAEDIMLPISALSIGLVGLYLALRGGRALWSLRRPKATATDHAESCGCGHRHAPSTEEIRRAGGLREAAVLIGSIAIRPCSGAILLLVLTWHMDILGTGILGAIAMSVGTAALTILVAVSSAFLRHSALSGLRGTSGIAIASPLIEVLAGSAILILSLRMAGLAF